MTTYLCSQYAVL